LYDATAEVASDYARQMRMRKAASDIRNIAWIDRSRFNAHKHFAGLRRRLSDLTNRNRTRRIRELCKDGSAQLPASAGTSARVAAAEAASASAAEITAAEAASAPIAAGAAAHVGLTGIGLPAAGIAGCGISA
jgi:hypothetical protein